jgi:hypothetical protein
MRLGGYRKVVFLDERCGSEPATRVEIRTSDAQKVTLGAFNAASLPITQIALGSDGGRTQIG